MASRKFGLCIYSYLVAQQGGNNDVITHKFMNMITIHNFKDAKFSNFTGIGSDGGGAASGLRELHASQSSPHENCPAKLNLTYS
jgi:hypothetical protein